MIEIEVNEQVDIDCRKNEASIGIIKKTDFNKLKNSLMKLQEAVEDLVSLVLPYK